MRLAQTWQPSSWPFNRAIEERLIGDETLQPPAQPRAWSRLIQAVLGARVSRSLWLSGSPSTRHRL